MKSDAKGWSGKVLVSFFFLAFRYIFNTLILSFRLSTQQQLTIFTLVQFTAFSHPKKSKHTTHPVSRRKNFTLETITENNVGKRSFSLLFFSRVGGGERICVGRRNGRKSFSFFNTRNKRRRRRRWELRLFLMRLVPVAMIRNIRIHSVVWVSRSETGSDFDVPQTFEFE